MQAYIKFVADMTRLADLYTVLQKTFNISCFMFRCLNG